MLLLVTHCSLTALFVAAAAATAAAGPKSQLDDTVYSQPALYVTNLIALELLRSREPDTVNGARVMAGLSLGEYCALVAAGAMSFSDGLKVWFMAAHKQD
jgi:[acyl-carrier-protein] S-malonyltransferase